jgi:glucose-6-phosphate 1-dehydrogenase
MSTPLATATSSPPPPGKHPAPPCTLVIFGAAGDLTKRLLMPALYNLSSDGLLDDKMKIIGVNHGELETSAWRDQLTESLKQFAADKAGAFHTSQLDERAWNWVADRLTYVAGEFETDDVFNKLKQTLGDSGNVIFYLAVSSRFFKPIVELLVRL